MALFHNCNFPKLLIAIGIPQDILMIMLFWDFYKKAYGQKPNKAQKSTAKNNGIAKSVKKVLWKALKPLRSYICDAILTNLVSGQFVQVWEQLFDQKVEIRRENCSGHWLGFLVSCFI